MRDPARIDRILGLIKEIWSQVPDWRLCQLIENVLYQQNIFYVEDTRLEEELLKFKDKYFESKTADQ